MLGIILGPDLIVKGVRDESGAQESGLKPGMKISAVCGVAVSTLDGYLAEVWAAGEYVEVVVDLQQSVVMQSTNRLARQAAKQWGCYLCSHRNPPYTVNCKKCARANPLKGEAESRYRKLSTKRALGEVLNAEEQEDVDILSSLLQGDAFTVPSSSTPNESPSGSPSATTPSRLVAFKSKVIGSMPSRPRGSSLILNGLGFMRQNSDSSDSLVWSRSEDNRVRELRGRREDGKVPLTEDEEEELRQLEEGFDKFIEQGVRQIHSVKGKERSAVGETTQEGGEPAWSRDEDNMFRRLSTLEKDSLAEGQELSEAQSKKLRDLKAKYEVFIAEGLQQMKKEASPTETRSIGGAIGRLWGGGSAKPQPDAKQAPKGRSGGYAGGGSGGSGGEQEESLQ